MCPDILDASGLTVATSQEITANLVAGLTGIYGADVTVDQNTEDGQWIGNIAQEAVDVRELAVSVYNSFDPDQAIGATLDQRVALNNIQRQGGTYTILPIMITVNQTVALAGLDDNFNSPTGSGFTIQDAAGNKYILQSSVTLVPGVYPLDFRAQQIGAVNPSINTVTFPLTIVPGVVSVNNPSPANTIGQTQENDIQLRTRRAQSLAMASTGYLNGLRGKILNLTGVTEAQLYENRGATTDANGIPPRSIWLIVAGGAAADIANTLYNTMNPGAPMKGAVTYNITTDSGALFVAQWDVPVSEPLYIQFNLKTTVAGFAFNLATIQAYIAANLAYGIGQYAETSAVTAQAVGGIQSQGGGGVPIDVKISIDNVNYVDYLATATLASQFTIAASNIFITVI